VEHFLVNLVFQVVTLCSDVIGYHFQGPECLHLQGEVTGDREWTLIQTKNKRVGRVCVGQQKAREEDDLVWTTTGTAGWMKSPFLIDRI